MYNVLFHIIWYALILLVAIAFGTSKSLATAMLVAMIGILVYACLWIMDFRMGWTRNLDETRLKRKDSAKNGRSKA